MAFESGETHFLTARFKHLAISNGIGLGDEIFTGKYGVFKVQNIFSFLIKKKIKES